MTILHGDNTVASRKQLQALIARAKTETQVVAMQAKDLSLSVLESLLSTQELFSQKKTVVIEGFLSLPKSKGKSQMAVLLNASFYDVILWEGKEIKITDLKMFPSAKVYVFKVEKKVFQFTESVYPGNAIRAMVLLTECEKNGDVDMCFAMLSRQVRMLIKARDGVFSGIPPFAQGRIKKQASLFAMDTLVSVYDKLTHIDEENKTSASPLSLKNKLDLLLLKI